MANRRPLCQRYRKGDTIDGDDMKVGQYFAIAEVDKLPDELDDEDRGHFVGHGYSVKIGPGLWFYFTQKEPALVFGRAARMSVQCSAYGVREAAQELMFCERHGADERVLLIGPGDNLDRKPDEIEDFTRWVQGVKERQQSAGWRPPTGPKTESRAGRQARPRGRDRRETQAEAAPTPGQPRAGLSREQA